MSTIFAQTIARAISDYRQFLRKYLNQSDRVRKLNELGLKDPELYKSETALFSVAWGVVKDIEMNIEIPEQNYYSYSGIAKFCEYLKEYLENYEIENEKVIHKAQKASRAMIQAIQMMSISGDQLDETLAKKLEGCNEVIATCGSHEQCDLHLNTLERQRQVNPNYGFVIDDFKDRVKNKKLAKDKDLVAA